MTVKVYISLTSGLKEVKKRQQKIMMILDSKNIKYEILDISEPGKESDKDFMQSNSTSKGGTASDPDPRHPLPPQVFNEEEYCGDFDQFELANEVDSLEDFLKLPPEERPQVHKNTLDTSKIDENHPNGKVIDEDKENKTDEEQNQDENIEVDANVEVERIVEGFEAPPESSNDDATDAPEKSEEIKGDDTPKEDIEGTDSSENKNLDDSDAKIESEITETNDSEPKEEITEPPEVSENIKDDAISGDAEKTEITSSEEEKIEPVNSETPQEVLEKLIEAKEISADNAEPTDDKQEEKDSQKNNEETTNNESIEEVPKEDDEEEIKKSDVPVEEFGDDIQVDETDAPKGEEQPPAESESKAPDTIVEESEEEISESQEISKEPAKDLTESEKLIQSEQQSQ